MLKNFRKTKQKEVIKEILQNTKTHPTADWIYEEARKRLPTISLGTVYRNLSMMRENGEILELNFGSSFSRYDGNPHPHYHFRCQKCGKVDDIDLDYQTHLDEKLKQFGYEIQGHRLEFFGLCSECNPKN